jgi:hypothetical protein
MRSDDCWEPGYTLRGQWKKMTMVLDTPVLTVSQHSRIRAEQYTDHEDLLRFYLLDPSN